MKTLYICKNFNDRSISMESYDSEGINIPTNIAYYLDTDNKVSLVASCDHISGITPIITEYIPDIDTLFKRFGVYSTAHVNVINNDYVESFYKLLSRRDITRYAVENIMLKVISNTITIELEANMRGSLLNILRWYECILDNKYKSDFMNKYCVEPSMLSEKTLFSDSIGTSCGVIVKSNNSSIIKYVGFRADISKKFIISPVCDFMLNNVPTSVEYGLRFIIEIDNILSSMDVSDCKLWDNAYYEVADYMGYDKYHYFITFTKISRHCLNEIKYKISDYTSPRQ